MLHYLITNREIIKDKKGVHSITENGLDTAGEAGETLHFATFDSEKFKACRNCRSCVDVFPDDDLGFIQQKTSGDILFYIHGFRTDLKTVLEDICALEEKYTGNDSPIERIVAITWPSRKSCFYYLDDAADAIQSGKTFAYHFDLVRSFATALCGDQKINMHLLVHSMGNRLLESMIEHLTLSEQTRFYSFFKEIIMAAPDIDWQAFEEEYALSKLPHFAERITVYHHSEDLALYISQHTYNHHLRLGRHGFRDIEKVPQNVYSVDCSHTDESAYFLPKIIDHSYHQYSHCAVKDILYVLRSKPVDEFLLDALRLSKGARQYAINYFSAETRKTGTAIL